jgi:hypothetical protein
VPLRTNPVRELDTVSDIQVKLLVPVEVNPEGRAVRMQGTKDDPLFHLADLCKVLNHTNSRVVAERLDDDEKAVRIVYTRGGLQPTTFVIGTWSNWSALTVRNGPFSRVVCGSLIR